MNAIAIPIEPQVSKITMNNIPISLENEFGERGIFPRKIISLNQNETLTPAVALPSDRLKPGEELHPVCRGVNEIYLKLTDQAIQDELTQNPGPITEKLEDRTANAREDELTIVFTTYEENDKIELFGDKFSIPNKLDSEQASCIIQAISPFTDIIPVPMFSSLAYHSHSNIGLDEHTFDRYLQSVVTFLNCADERRIDKPIMGGIPVRLPWICLEKMFEIYVAGFNLNGFYLDLDRLKFTAQKRLSNIEQIMEHVAKINLEENSLFYLINAERGDVNTKYGSMTAADFAAFGFGVDIVGGRRRSPRTDWSEIDHEPDSFYLFDRENYMYHKIDLMDLMHHFPTESSFEVEYVLDRIEATSSFDELYRLQPLVNAELQSMAANNLRHHYPEEDSPYQFRAKEGITNSLGDDMIRVRANFDRAIEERAN